MPAVSLNQLSELEGIALFRLMCYNIAMKRKLAVFDIDGTLFRSSLYTELVYEMIAAGIIKDPSFIEDIRAKKEAWVERRDSQAYPTYDQSVAAGVDTMLTSISSL